MVFTKVTGLPDIKVTQPKSTEPPLKSWAQPKFTAKPLAAYANSSAVNANSFINNCTQFNTRIKGLNAETVAIRYFEKLGAVLICRNLPTVFSEIDLVFLSADREIWLVEVKLVAHDELIFARPVKKQQMQRLKRLIDRWIESVDKPVRFHLAAVNHENEVLVFEDFLS